MPNQFKSALRFRLIKIFFLVTFLPMLMMSVINYGFTYKDCKNMLQKELMHLAKGATTMIDPIQLKQLEIDKSKHSHAYQTTNHLLSTYKKQVDATYIYILKKDMNTTYFLVDGGEIGEEDQSYIGEKYDLNQYMEKAFNGKADITDAPYTDRWGTFLTGYAPILDTNGSIYAVVGVDMDVSKLKTLQENLFLQIALICITCFIISLFLANALTENDVEQVSKIQEALLKAGEGDFSVCKIDKKDWVGTRIVINSFNKTVGKIKILMDKSREANRLKSDFMSTMSHELRNPLNSIIGYTHLVLNQAQDTLSPKHKKHLQTVERNGQHLLGLIEQMLDLSAIEAGKKDLTLKKFNCVRLINEVIELALPLAHQKK